MSVTITRRQVIELGERTIAQAQSMRPNRDISSAPEVVAFRQVLELSPALARATYRSGDVVCPMRQTVFGTQSSLAFGLALSWDDVTRNEFGATQIINVNPLTKP